MMMISAMLRSSLRPSHISFLPRNIRVASFGFTPFDLGCIVSINRRKLPNSKVCILGSNGRIGQQIAFLLKIHPFIAHLALYDLPDRSCRFASLLSELTTRTEAVGNLGGEEYGLADTLDGSDLVIVTAGVPKPETSTDDLYNENVSIVRNLCSAIVKYCPQACVHMVSNPTCSLPIAKEVFQKAGTYDWRKLFGVLSDRVGTTPAGCAPQIEDTQVVTSGIDHYGMEMFQGTPEDAMTIAFASVAFADDYLCTLYKRSSVFSFMDSTDASHIKLLTSNPCLA